MQALTLFDPWKSKLCTCPLKYSFSPYIGCSHSCLYCYASSYIKDFDKPRAKKEILKKLENDLKKLKNPYVSISNSSDPYQHLEKKLKLTRDSLKILSRHNAKVMIITKSNLVLRDLDILKRIRVAVSITITTLDEKKAKKLEPNASLPEERIDALKKLNKEKIPTIARIDPIIPFINENEIEELVKKVAEANVKHIVSSTYKAKIDNFRRMKIAFPEEMKKLKEIFKLGERISGYYYLPKELRFKLMKKVKNEAEKYNLTFAACREGFFDLNTATCDGSHLIK